MDLEGLSGVCAGLGLVQEDENGVQTGYAKSEFCLDNLKDLQRFLRRDDPQTRDVFKQVCKWNTVLHDLVPIIEHYQVDRDLVINAVKVLVFLTMPIDPASDDIAQQIEYLWNLKESTTRSDTIAVIVSLVEDPLEHLERGAFAEDDWKLVQLVLTLFRNILAIQEISLQQKASGSATQFLSLRERFLELMFQENVMELILVLSQHVGGSCGYLRQDNLLLLETFHYIFLGQEPELIAKASRKDSMVDEDIKASIKSLNSIINEEKDRRRLTRLQNLDRSSQFSGTFTCFAVDGSKTVLKRNPATILKAHNVQRGPLKRTVWDHGRLSLPNENILELLHDFINQFLSGGYNVLMQSIREDIEKEHHAIQTSDVNVFFQVSHFITAYQHHKFSISKIQQPTMETAAFETSSGNKYVNNGLFQGEICGPILVTMNEAMFLLVMSRWREAFDGLKETHNYKFLSAAGSLMKDMICMLDLVLQIMPEDSKEAQTARILLYKIFYDQTDQGMTQFLLNQLKSFDSHKQPRSDLADLVEIIHKVLQLMEDLQARGTLRVSRKSRKVKKKKILGDSKASGGERLDKEHCSVNKDDELKHEIGNSTCEPIIDVIESLNEHSADSSSGKKEESTSVPCQIEELEKPLLDTGNYGDNSGKTNDKNYSNSVTDLADGTDCSDDDRSTAMDEVDFSVSRFVAAFASNSVIQNLCWLLKYYRSNSASTNHYVISILQRICHDLELSPMLYQLSLLTTFYNILNEIDILRKKNDNLQKKKEILNDQKSCISKDYTDIFSFLTKLVRKMLRKMKSQPLLFVEVLFWKTRKECHYINSESLLHKLGNLKKESRHWGSISGKGEIDSLKGKGGLAGRNIADSLGEDEVDFMIPREHYYQKEEDPSDRNLQKIFYKTKDGVGKMKNSVVSTSNDEISGEKVFNLDGHHNEGPSLEQEYPKASRREKRLPFDIDQETMIKDLFEKYKDNRKCSRLIAEALDPDGTISPVQVSYKLKQFGLKVCLKKKTLHVDESFSGGDDQVKDQGTALTSATTLTSNELENGSILESSSHTRKRIRAFSKEQELMVKDLFEQFKNHKRCSHMIANALDADNMYTAAQVSRKLRQLGLHIPRQKRPSEATTHSGSQDVNDLVEVEREEQSDEETLLALMERRKIMEKSKLIGKEAIGSGISKWKSRITSPQEDSDDEILSSILKKSGRRLLPKEKDEKLTTSFLQEMVTENNLARRAPQYMIESDANVGSDEPGPSHIDGGVAADLIDLDDNLDSEMEVAEKVAASLGNVADLAHQQMYDELADELADELSDELPHSGDDVGPAVPKNIGFRRKMKLAIDFEDDD